MVRDRISLSAQCEMCVEIVDSRGSQAGTHAQPNRISNECMCVCVCVEQENCRAHESFTRTHLQARGLTNASMVDVRNRTSSLME